VQSFNAHMSLLTATSASGLGRCWSSHQQCYLHCPLSEATRVSQYQKGKTNLDFTEARDSEWQWHQLGRMQVCNSLQTDNHASTPPLSFQTGRMPFLPPSQQRRRTQGTQETTSTNYICIPNQLSCTTCEYTVKPT